MFNKKGLEARIIILIIILIISFTIILFFYWQFNWKGQITRDACHQSVILKKTMPEYPLVGGKIVDLPLKCKTERICFSTKSSGDCSITLGKIDYKTVKVKDRNELIREISNLMVEDWTMMGQGKGGMIFTKESTFKSYNQKGVITSVFAFADDIQKKPADFTIKSDELSHFMSLNIMPLNNEGLTYWQFLMGSKAVITPQLGSGKFQTIDISETYSIIFSEFEKTKLPKILTVSAGVITGFYAGAKIGGVAGGLIGTIVPGVGNVGLGIVGAIGGGFVGAIGGGIIQEKWEDVLNMGDYYSKIDIVPFDAEYLKELNMYEFEGLA